MLLASTIRPSQTISSASEKETLTTSMNSSRVSGEFARLKIRRDEERDEEPDHLVRKTGCGIYIRVRAVICDARIPVSSSSSLCAQSSQLSSGPAGRPAGTS